MKKIFVVIVTYNAMKWAERCFSSLRKSSVPVQCIVVDNGSTDGSRDYIKNNFPEVDFIQSKENLGFGKANNLGIEKAYKNGADFFYLMNQDAWLYCDSIEKLLDVYQNHPNPEEIGILSPMHLDGSEENLDIFFERYLARNTTENRIISGYVSNKIKDYYNIDFVNAAHWLLPKSTIELVGGFNPYFFHYSEDNEYVNRIHYFNKKVLIATNSKVVHDGKQDFSKTCHIDSTRVQREERYLNPINTFSKQKMIRDLMMDAITLFLKGNFKLSNYYWKELHYFKNKAKTISDSRDILSNNKHAFLRL